MSEIHLNPARIAQLDELCQKLGVPFEKKELLSQALTHSSYKGDVIDAAGSQEAALARSPDALQDYERMEFFGDAVLKFVASEYLFRRFESYSEGKLTEIRAVLVSAKMLEEMAAVFDLGKYILIGRRVPLRQSIIARSMEAIFGAIYLDSNFTYVAPLIVRLLDEKASLIHEDAMSGNFKARLQIHTQGNGLGVPSYEVVEKRGPAHDPFFVVRVLIQGTHYGQGEGPSKKIAEQEAASQALDKLLQKQ